MTHLIDSQCQRGMNEVYSLPDRRLKELSFGIANLKKGDRFGETLNKREAVLVLLKGAVNLKGDGYNHGEITGRNSITDEKTTAIYCPPGLFASKAITDTQIAILRRWCDSKYKGEKSTVVMPEKIQTENLNGIIKREVFQNNNPASGFKVGEALINHKTTDIQNIILSKAITENKAEALIYVFNENENSCGEFSLKSPLEEESGTITSGQALIVPAGSDLKLTLAENTYCVWIEGKIEEK